MGLTSREAARAARVSESGRQPVVFVHGLRLLPSSWAPEIVEIEGRGHSRVIDAGWSGVADAALDFLGRHDAD